MGFLVKCSLEVKAKSNNCCNILLDANGRAKVSDWGTAKFSDMTTSRNEAFTLTYATPERGNG